MCQIRHWHVSDWETQVSTGNISTHHPGISCFTNSWADFGQLSNPSIFSYMLNPS